MKLPDELDLPQLGLSPAGIQQIELIQRKHGNALYRLGHEDGAFILKWFADQSTAVEVHAYALLKYYGVPTLPVYGQSECALLLDDLTVSSSWRLAEAADIAEASVGAAVAAWYRKLHAAGEAMLAGAGVSPSLLSREVDALSPEGVLALGAKLGLARLPVWMLAAKHLDALKAAFRAFPETLNFNDFHWTNLALSRDAPLRAVVFDYHLLGIGPAYCDYRNVLGSLGKEARAAFRATYGPVDERVAMFDAPLSTLYSLQVAAQLPQLPGWALGVVQHAASGGLEADLRKALTVVGRKPLGARPSWPSP